VNGKAWKHKKKTKRSEAGPMDWSVKAGVSSNARIPQATRTGAKKDGDEIKKEGNHRIISRWEVGGD